MDPCTVTDSAESPAKGQDSKNQQSTSKSHPIAQRPEMWSGREAHLSDCANRSGASQEGLAGRENLARRRLCQNGPRVNVTKARRHAHAQ